jgi:hypothetical protein
VAKSQEEALADLRKAAEHLKSACNYYATLTLPYPLPDSVDVSVLMLHNAAQNSSEARRFCDRAVSWAIGTTIKETPVA